MTVFFVSPCRMHANRDYLFKLYISDVKPKWLAEPKIMSLS